VDALGLRAGQMSVSVHERRVAVLIAGEETGDRFALVETVEVRDAKQPRHLHHREDETLYVLEGALSVWVTGGWVEAPAGTAVFLPRGIEHASVVTTRVARVLTLLAPAGFEGFYREMGAAGEYPPDVERLVVTAARFGCEITGPTPKRRCT
jgi:quercetin dioxygenase-like cupin family protein